MFVKTNMQIVNRMENMLPVISTDNTWKKLLQSDNCDGKSVKFDFNLITSNIICYFQDKLGLKTMDKAGKLHFLPCPSDHLQFTEQWFADNIINKFL